MSTSKKKFGIGTIVTLVALVAVLLFAAFTTTAESVQETFWALVPPIVAIALALVTKEVYSSLFIGVLTGGLLYSGFSFEGTINHVYSEGIVAVLSDPYNVGIIIFLVILGIVVSLMNKSGCVGGVWPLGADEDQESCRRAAGDDLRVF